MPMFKRASSNKLDRWFFTVNKPILITVIVLLIIGVILSLSASPYVAIRVGYDPLHFFYHHIFYSLLSVIVLIAVSFLDREQLKSVVTVIFIINIIAIIIMFIIHIQVKGAERWIRIGGMSIQPSEFVKVCFPMVLASVFEQVSKKNKIFAYSSITCIYGVTTGLIIMQPDLGMAILISCVFVSLLFILEVRLVWLLMFGILGVIGLVAAYLLFSHVHYRIDSFFKDDKPYQVMKALEALQNGGFFGLGAGEGYFKQYLPDAHTDFIFVVAIEEYGLVFAIILVMLFLYVLLTIFNLLKRVKDYFSYISIIGLTITLMIQLFIHIGSNINLIPTKGMTLPFISYGGTSLIANALLIGSLLVLTKKEY